MRRLAALVAGLPLDAATVIVRLGDRAGWDIADSQRADIVDALRIANWQRANAGKRPFELSPRPSPSWRPVPLVELAQAEGDEITARLLKQRERLGTPGGDAGS